jgi:hypothetical protein
MDRLNELKITLNLVNQGEKSKIRLRIRALVQTSTTTVDSRKYYIFYITKRPRASYNHYLIHLRANPLIGTLIIIHSHASAVRLRLADGNSTRNGKSP